jgi:hypothetical protein
MSEQDKRPVFMGNFERFKKETHVKHEDVISKIDSLGKLSMFNIILAGIALGVALVALAI